MEHLREAYDRVEIWARGKDEAILSVLPFNPLVVRNAFNELIDDDKVTGWKYVADLLGKDASLTARLIEEANGLLREKRKEREINSLQDGIAVVGNRRTRQVLETAISRQICERLKELPFAELQFLWKKSWALGFAAEKVASFLKEKTDKAFSCGILANIGQLVMIQLYRSDYILNVDGGIKDRFEKTGFERSELERRFFGVSNAELSAWLLTRFGFQADYAHAALLYQREDATGLESIWPTLTIFAHRVASYLLMEDRYKQLHQGRESLDELDKFSREKNKFLFELLKEFNTLCGLDQGQARAALEEIEVSLKDYQMDITGSLRMVDEFEFVKAIKDIDESRKAALDSLLRKMDGDITDALPAPLAADYLELSAMPEKDYEGIGTVLNRLVRNYTRILVGSLLALAFKSLGQKEFSALLRGYFRGLPDQGVYIEYEDGIRLAAEFADKLNESGEPPSQLVPYYLREQEHILKLHETLKSLGAEFSIEIKTAVELVYRLLKSFAALDLRYWIAVDIDFLFSANEEKYQVQFLTWQGAEDLAGRQPKEIKSKSPVPKSSQGLYLIEKNRRIFLPRLLVYAACPSCGQSHVYLPERIYRFGTQKNTLGFDLAPVSANQACKKLRNTIAEPAGGS